MIATGKSGDGSQVTEVIDLENEENICHHSLNFPLEVSGAIGFQNGYHWPIICGGDCEDLSIKKECFDLATSEKVADMQIARRYSSSISYKDGGFVFGGYGYGDGYESSVEMFQNSSNAWPFTFKRRLPVTVQFACAIKWKEEAWIIGGTQNGPLDRSNQTWRASLPRLDNWTKGPQMRYAREEHGCGVIANHGLLVVFGGYSDGSETTEVLNFSENTFELGTDMLKIKGSLNSLTAK